MKRAIVTGASRGIGKGIAIALAQDGYDIAFSYRSEEEKASKVCSEIESLGVRCSFFQASLEKPGEGKRFFDEAVDFLGGVDLLVNNAGRTICEPLTEITEENLDMLLSLDFRNYVLMMKYASSWMIENGVRGSIVNITSTRGFRAYPSDGIYGGLKAGLNRAIESFALDVAKYGIRINNVAPGAIQVRKPGELKSKGLGLPEDFYENLGSRIPLGRMGRVEDVADAVLFLSSEKASYLTGITLKVEGGLTLPGMPELVPEGTRPGDWNVGMRSVNVKDNQ